MPTLESRARSRSRVEELVSVDRRADSALSIGDAARETGLGVHALRFYERNELLVDPIERTPGGRRRYSGTDVEWLKVCVKLRESGMPLSELRRFAALVRQGAGNEAERLRLLQDHETRVRAQLASITEFLNVITGKVAVYRNHLASGGTEDPWSHRNQQNG